MMQSQMPKESSVKYTIILPQTSIDTLKSMARDNVIPSIDQGILTAIEEFVKAHKRAAYEASMREAADDPNFIERTMKMQEDFTEVDLEDFDAW